eukprot:m.75188 g.75188  ORF g.75188 m.75188 type:complete len:190 (-) comp12438_c0_seq1:165-734(-)
MHVNDAYSIAQAQHIDSPHQLTPQIGVSLDEPLVDPQGYPRSDIDVYQARHIRSEIRTLKTDHAQIMKEAEEMLVAIHQRAKEHGGELHPSDRPKMIAKKPILRVLDVLPGSPAFEAGMQRGDIIGAFGSLQSSNMRGMADVAALVTSSIGKIIRLEVERGEVVKVIELRPHTWEGKGVLGCALEPTTS